MMRVIERFSPGFLALVLLAMIFGFLLSPALIDIALIDKALK